MTEKIAEILARVGSDPVAAAAAITEENAKQRPRKTLLARLDAIVKAAGDPDGFGPGGRRLWERITGDYELRPDERRILEDACREVDLIDRMQDALRGGELMVRGSQGQKVASPLVTELRQHRAVVARLLSSLKLPDADTDAGDSDGRRSESARQAAMARWHRGA